MGGLSQWRRRVGLVSDFQPSISPDGTSLKRDAKKGNNSLRFQGRLTASKRLALGRYRLSATARDAAGNPQVQTRRKNFRLVRR